MEPPHNSWPNTKYAKDGVFFAQSLRELLRERNFESFRVRTLDNLTRLREINTAATRIVAQGKIKTNLLPMLEEISEEAKSDNVLKSVTDEYFEPFLNFIKKPNLSSYDFIDRLGQYSRRIYDIGRSNYEDRTRNELRSALQRRNNRIEVRSLSHQYLTILINSGFDKRYLRSSVEEEFFQSKIDTFNISNFDRFVRRFPEGNDDFEVLIPVSRSQRRVFSEFDPSNAHVISFKDAPDKLQELINKTPAFSEKDYFFRRSYSARDPFGASRACLSFVRRYLASSIVDDIGVSFRGRAYSFARRKSDNEFRAIHEEASHLQPITETVTKKHSERLAGSASAIVRHFNKAARSRIVAANETVSLVRSSEDSENQIALIWSAIESLLGDSKDPGSRISYYIDILAPCICLNYCWRYSRALHTQVVSHHRKALEGSLEDAGIEKSISDLSRFNNFIFDPDSARFHKPFLAKLERNPALQHAIFRFHRDFGKAAALNKSVRDHENRVRWQIHRIYRVRNDFIHSGRRPAFVKSLAQNSYEYYRTFVRSLTHHCQQLIFDQSVTADQLSIPHVANSIRLSYDLRLHQMAALSDNESDKGHSLVRFFERI